MKKTERTINEIAEKTDWCVLPVRSKSKVPLLTDWPNQASNKPKTIQAWSAQYPEGNWGILTGIRSGVLVVDVDPRNGGNESLQSLEATYGPLPKTVRVKTGGGGEHVYFRLPKSVRQWPKELAPGIDLKGDGGFVVAPGSTHPDGGTYDFQENSSPWDVELADAPEWLLGVAKEKKEPQPQVPDKTIPEGLRNNTLFRELSSARARGYSEGALRGVAEARNRDCAVPLETKEIESLVKSVTKYNPGSASFDLTDLGNAKRLVHYHGEDLRYCFAWKVWLVWNGKRWVRDETGEIHRRAKDIVDRILQEAIDEVQGDRKKDLSDWAKRTQNKDRIKAMVELATSEKGIPVTPEELDKDSMLLNLQNGTLDLRTGKLLQHDRCHLLTKMAPVAYDEEAECPVWKQFLERVMDESPSKIQLLQNISGYTLTGDTREQKLFFFHGKGENGKSTYLELIRDMMGEYAMNTPTDSLMMKRGQRNSQ